MVARWMQSKLLKQRRERRAWAKPYSIKTAGPNWSNGRQAKDISLDLNLERRLANEKATRVSRVPDITEVRKQIPDPYFVVVTDTPFHRCRMYWNGERTKFILQYVLWRTKEVRISITYPTSTRAMFVWMEDKVRWRIIKPF